MLLPLRRNRLLPLRLLRINCRVLQKRTWKRTSHQNLLPLHSRCLHCPSHSHPLLHQQVGQLQKSLRLDVVSPELRRRVHSGGFRQFECIGSSTVFRVSLSFLCLFGLMLLFMLCRTRISLCLNEGFFCVKYLFVLGIFIAFLFAPNQSFLDYA